MSTDQQMWGIHGGRTGDANTLFYPEKKAGAIPVNAGQLFRFVHEAKSGDERATFWIGVAILALTIIGIGLTLAGLLRP